MAKYLVDNKVNVKYFYNNGMQVCYFFNNHSISKSFFEISPVDAPYQLNEHIQNSQTCRSYVKSKSKKQKKLNIIKANMCTWDICY